jgi:cobalamin biosynthesis protein CobT
MARRWRLGLELRGRNGDRLLHIDRLVHVDRLLHVLSAVVGDVRARDERRLIARRRRC